MREFTFKGATATSKGVHVEELPPLVLPAMRNKPVPVPGRHGSLNQTDDCFEEFPYAIKCVLEPNANISAVKAWLTGDGWLQLDTVSGRAYKARMINQIDFTRIMRVYNTRRFTVIFRCFPFAYFWPTPAAIVVTASNTNITNPGTYASDPIMTVTGAGDVTLMIRGQPVQLFGLDPGKPIVLDTPFQEAYNGWESMNRQHAGDFPILMPGSNMISWLGTVHQIRIEPNWRDI